MEIPIEAIMETTRDYFSNLSRFLGNKYGPLSLLGQLITGQEDTPVLEDLNGFLIPPTTAIPVQPRLLLLQLIGLMLPSETRRNIQISCKE
jgi:hypothetical protein